MAVDQCSSRRTTGTATKKLFLGAVLLLALKINTFAVANTIVEYLPGYSGKLPFKLETGYVSVGDNDEIELFYYFIESERNPVRDPLLLWLTGGPGCSGFSGLVFEIGPLKFDYATFNGSSPTLLPNPYSWTQIANIIFLDAPVSTGFSYSTTQEGYYTTDTKSAKDIYKFLRKWILGHPKFGNNPLYIAGDSYSGKIVPQVALLASNGIIAGEKPTLYLLGYMLGNPVTDLDSDQNSRVEYQYRVSLISTELYECTLKVCDAAILEPKCSYAKPRSRETGLNWGIKFFDDDMPLDLLQSPSTKGKENWCRNENYVLAYMWANEPSVQSALNIRNGTIPEWTRCNKSLAYEDDLNSTVPYHYDLIEAGYRALVYSGDHDMLIPYVATEKWIYSLNMTVLDYWRPWFVDGQVAGYTFKSTIKLGDGMTYATVKGAGHTAPEYNPKQCLEMADRWLSHYSL
ncbi:serine carboxypeptidase-like 16 isoform X2 [Syzygium oleosum]|uniref:serine carboxypeptidase-like 16 isoform X2 n=1 Tax=Syzygium oleosum TaxID=219896 RepID=UPI0024BAF8A4|nr:serine carboxypeptidase-like 16 isoform X2 [Syzygium oleosum]